MMEKFFISNLNQLLIENIKGKISVHIENGDLIVTIEPNRYTVYNYVKHDILSDIMLPFSVSDITAIRIF